MNSAGIHLVVKMIACLTLKTRRVGYRPQG